MRNNGIVSIDFLLQKIKDSFITNQEKYDHAFFFRQCLQASKEGYEYLLVFWSEGEIEFVYFNDDECTIEEAVEEFLLGSIDVHVASIRV